MVWLLTDPIFAMFWVVAQSMFTVFSRWQRFSDSGNQWINSNTYPNFLYPVYMRICSHKPWEVYSYLLSWVYDQNFRKPLRKRPDIEWRPRLRWKKSTSHRHLSGSTTTSTCSWQQCESPRARTSISWNLHWEMPIEHLFISSWAIHCAILLMLVSKCSQWPEIFFLLLWIPRQTWPWRLRATMAVM